MRSFESSFETPKGCLSCSISPGKSLFPDWEQKNFSSKKRLRIFSGKCRIVPKNVKGGTVWALLIYILLQNIKKTRRGTRLRH